MDGLDSISGSYGWRPLTDSPLGGTAGAIRLCQHAHDMRFRPRRTKNLAHLTSGPDVRRYGRIPTRLRDSSPWRFTLNVYPSLWSYPSRQSVMEGFIHRYFNSTPADTGHSVKFVPPLVAVTPICGPLNFMGAKSYAWQAVPFRGLSGSWRSRASFTPFHSGAASYPAIRAAKTPAQIGRASCRERVCQYV